MASEHVTAALRLENEEGKIVWWWPMLTLLASKVVNPTKTTRFQPVASSMLDNAGFAYADILIR